MVRKYTPFNIGPFGSRYLHVCSTRFISIGLAAQSTAQQTSPIPSIKRLLAGMAALRALYTLAIYRPLRFLRFFLSVWHRVQLTRKQTATRHAPGGCTNRTIPQHLPQPPRRQHLSFISSRGLHGIRNVALVLALAETALDTPTMHRDS